MQRRQVLAVVILGLLLATPARADDAEAARSFRRAEIEESAFGRIEKAAGLYHDAAAAASSPALRARAALREGSCLLRLGRRDEAKALLAPIAAGEEVPEDVRRAAKGELESPAVAAAEPAPPQPTAGDPDKLARLERELEDTRAQFADALRREDKRSSELAQKVRQQDEELRTMRAERAPSSPEEALRIRVREQDERRRRDTELSRNYSNFARLRHQEGNFPVARDFLHFALEKDKDNVEAKALLKLVSAPLSDRERLYEEILGVLALANEVRGARTGAEIDALVAEGVRRQESSEFGASVVPLERALSLVEGASGYVRDPDASREKILSLLTAAQGHGAPRAPVEHALPTTDAESRGLAAVRELLASAGSEVVRGLDLRFHDVDAILGASATALAPAAVGPAPVGWTIANESSETAALLVAYLRSAESDSFSAPGATLEPTGPTLTAICDAASQSRLAERIARLLDVTAPAADVRVTAYRAAPGDVAALLDRRRIRSQPAGDGARSASVPGTDLDAIASELGQRGEAWPSVATLRATPLRAFRLVAGTAASSVSIDVLPVTKPTPGAGVRVTSEWTPAGRRDGTKLRQSASAGGVLEPGAALLLFGMADPADPTRDLVVVVRLGEAASASSGTPASARGSSTEGPPFASAGLSSSEMLLPLQIRGLTEIGPLASEIPGPPLASREQAIAARVRAVAKSATSVEVKDDRVRVVGPEEARDAARRFLDQIDVVRGMQSFDVRLHQIDAAREQEIARVAPRFTPGASSSFSWALLRGDERRNVERILESASGRVPLLESRVSAPSTGLAPLVQLVRSAYRSRAEPVPAEPRWGTTETALADQGLVLALRPFGRTTTGRVDLDLSLRAVWISDRGERRRETALGTMTWSEPALAQWAGELSVMLADEEALVLLGMASPLAAGGKNDRLAVVVTNAPPR